MNKKAIIIGAGPAGLTAAYELLKRTDITPIILEKSGDIGGISKTVQYKGNRIDIGGHRFFSKSDRVMNWWMNMMPVEEAGSFTISYQNKSRAINTSMPEAKDPDKVMLVRQRLSRIYFLRKFFTYPIQLSIDTLTKLGIGTTIAILFSYLKAQLLPRKPEQNLEDFMINRFGKTLYQLFFKDYTEKVWGIPCDAISAEWGAQRIKGVSISKAIQHAIQTTVKRRKKQTDLSQKGTETSLIEQFLYPKYGPGQLWEEVARQVQEMGGEIRMHQEVKHIYTSGSNNAITAIAAIDNITGESSYLEGDYFFSTMPVQELIGGMDGSIPDDVKHVASGLQYRDFITVGILLKKLSFQDKKTKEWKPIELKDTWIYIQEKDVKVGRLQLFNNWSPYMVKDPDTVWVGMEFFCNTDDSFWQLPDAEIKQLAIRELEKIGLASGSNVLDATVLRMEKTYPAYFGTYNRFDVIRNYIDKLENLFLVGRNGMHKYNNSDHSMLTAMVAVDNICAGVTDKANIWEINTEQEYHEEKSAVEASKDAEPTQAAPQLAATSFAHFVFRQNKVILWAAAVCLLLQFIVFKWMYPYANFMPDSYSYLEAAVKNADINTWPVGYSKFLRVFSAFVRSDVVLVFFQYVALQAAILYFLFTLLYFLKPGKIVSYCMLLFLMLNPVTLYTSNYVATDALFTALSLLWITQLIWLLNRPKSIHMWIQVALLLLLFMIRYNALYYPFISAAVILASRLRWRIKIAGVGLSILLISVFIWHNGNKYGELTGKRQFAAFGGWQMANNALFMYSHMPNREKEKVPAQFAGLHQMVTHHIDSLSHCKLRADTAMGIYYLWDERAPLIQYLAANTHKDTTSSYFKRWASISPLYGSYGLYLIEKHPLAYAKYYLWPNTLNYYAPPVEFLGMYNMKEDSIERLAKDWFGYKSLRVKSYSKNIGAFKFYPVLVTIINILFIVGIIGFVLLKGFRRTGPVFSGVLILITGIWLFNFFFSVLASPIVLRYQLFPIFTLFAITLILLEFIYKSDSQPAKLHHS